MSGYRKTGMALLVVGILAVGLGGTPPASAKGKVPPSINDLLGVYQEKEKGVDYDLLDGYSEKFKDTGTVTITKIDNETVNLHFNTTGSSWDDQGYYGGGGVIVTGNSDSGTLGDYTYFQMIMISGSPGKLKAKGTWATYNLNDGYVEMGSFSMKQTG